jgi:hypothetical protein
MTFATAYDNCIARVHDVCINCNPSSWATGDQPTSGRRAQADEIKSLTNVERHVTYKMADYARPLVLREAGA